jgi:hypothetical protein
MDTVSLPQATFVLALAKNSIRERILDRFMMLVQTELPVAEYSQRRTAGMLKRSRDINAFRRLISIPGFPKDPERALAKYRQQDMQKYCKKAAEIYRFHNLMNFFRADVYNDEVMTPVQREFIRLAQIFKSQMIAEIELKQRVVERALIQDYGTDASDRNAARKNHEAATKKLQQSSVDVETRLLEVRQKIFKTLVATTEVTRDRNVEINEAISRLKHAQELIEFVGPRNLSGRLKALGGTKTITVGIPNGMLLDITFHQGAEPERLLKTNPEAEENVDAKNTPCKDTSGKNVIK